MNETNKSYEYIEYEEKKRGTSQMITVCEFSLLQQIN